MSQALRPRPLRNFEEIIQGSDSQNYAVMSMDVYEKYKRYEQMIKNRNAYSRSRYKQSIKMDQSIKDTSVPKNEL